MFAKPYKTKAHNSLKGSARKSLVQKIKAAFPVLSEDDLKELVPLKAPLSSMKVTTFAGEDVGLHIVDSVPIMMEMFDVLYPTVYAMWRCPHMLPSLTIFNTVASKFSEGNYHVSRGHLFIPPRGTRLPSFSKGSLVSVNMTDNKAAILVGVANYSTGDLPQVVRGQCVKTLQMFGDLLCKFEKFTRLERPKLGLPYGSPEESQTVTEELSKMILNDDEADVNETNNKDSNENTKEDHPENNSSETSPDDSSGVDEHGFPVDMDKLLEYCLLCVLKTEGKRIVLPLKTNLLYANHMTTYCPSERTLDVKKSSYKKMAKFLEAMEKDGLLQVKPLEKGVDAVVGVDFAHPSIKSHVVITETQSGIKLGNKKPTDDDSPSFSAPGVKEMYKITAAVLPLFEKQNYKRGDALTASQASNALVAYVRRNNLQNTENKNLVNVDPLLAHITPADVTITWEDLKACILKKMTNCTEMTFADGSSTINTGKLPMITMQVANRSGNKKVTLVSNLHYYGISLAALSKECQHGVAASCSITKSAGSKFDQLLVQGNQTYFLAKHLTEFYKLPKRFIEGAEKALASKKK